MSNAELESGIYVIKTHATERVVSRGVIEDGSHLPKPIYALSEDGKPAEAPKWQVEKTSDGLYKLSVRDPAGPWSRSPGERIQHLYVFPKGGSFDGSVDWKISHVHVTDGKKGYIIQTTLSGGENIGWSAYGSEVAAFGIPIAVRPLPSTRTLPPQYFPTDVFQFTRIDRDDE